MKKQNLCSRNEFHRDLETDVLARTLWGEARGEGMAGMAAVAAVVLNRVRIARRRGGFWWGDSVIQVCQKPYQFSCWNRDDPNYRKLMDVGEGNVKFATALRVARRALLGLTGDPTDGATHYHAAGMMPDWAAREKPVAVIGRHVFYRLEN